MVFRDMAKQKTEYQCQECGYASAKWLGKCPDCNQWNSFIESQKLPSLKGRAQSSKELNIVTIKDVEIEKHKRWQTGLEEFDRVLGGGITVGSLNLIGGEPGIGKSTLLLEVCSKLVQKHNEKILYISGEESEGQIAGRFRRMGLESDELLILHETRWSNIQKAIETVKPSFLVLDSIQTTVMEELGSAPGTLSQIREVTYELMNLTKAQGMSAFVIGHVTKEGQIAGPKVLEHMVDAVLSFEGDTLHHYRLLRAMKNRFGSTQEVGIFEMGGTGLMEVPNPSLYFLEGSLPDSYGRALTCIQEGSRSLFVEIQALVIENQFGNGRRVAQGIDQNRLSLLLAVIEKYLDIPMAMRDVYVNIAGGIKLKGREGDLAIIAAILSSHFSKILPDKWIYLGEVGLTGEIRRVIQLEQRFKEIERMGFEKVLLSPSQKEEKCLKIKLHYLRTISEFGSLL